jgi:LAO/AO transport system kinase
VPTAVDGLAEVRAGDRGALSRLCRQLADEAVAPALLDAVFAARSQAWTIGVTGSPGAGKSVLVSRLIGKFRARGLRVGVVAVDPSSPFSGGALLGDRVRMQEHVLDPEVFVRSLATRGALGGLATATADTAAAFGLWGAQVVLIETVGVGQAELNIKDLCDTTLVLMAPGLGDAVQAAKAGILEIADLLLVSKADQPDAARTFADFQAMLSLAHAVAPNNALGAHHGPTLRPAATEPSAHWDIKLCRVSANDDASLLTLLQALDEHHAWLATALGQEQTAARQQRAARQRLQRRLHEVLEQHHGATLDSSAAALTSGQVTLSAALADVTALVPAKP